MELRASDSTEDATRQLESRAAAIRTDCVLGNRGMGDSVEALAVWQAVVQGNCSVVDSFDSEGRRFMLLRPNKQLANERYPRLTRREREIVAYAALGESRKATGYRLGISPPRVSCVLSEAMRKLGVKNQAQLVLLMRSFQVRADAV